MAITPSEPIGRDLPDTEEELFQLSNFLLLDINVMQEIGVSSVSLMHELLTTMACEQIPKDLGEITDAYTKGDWDSVEKIAHRMKGGAAYLGTVKMKFACQYLERYQKAGHNKLLEPLYQQVIAVVNETQQHILAWLEDPKFDSK